MLDIDRLTDEQFRGLPLVVEGESKEVRYAGEGLAVLRFKPTLYSATAGRSGVVEGSERLRLRATRVFLEALRKAGVRHAYRAVNDRFVLSELVLQPATSRCPEPFRPDDLLAGELEQLAVAPPIEVVVERMHSGGSEHRYFGMTGHPARRSHPLFAGMSFGPVDAYPEPFVRFNWRNPPEDDLGRRLAHEVLGDQMAGWFIDTAQARRTALAVYQALMEFLAPRDIVVYDLCLFLTEDGRTVFGEISQDCGRFRHFHLGPLDKDVGRAGGSNAELLERWRRLLEAIEMEL
jgi:phosphoribosylaminoimidazole-succinocarboxamide synthase